MTDVRPFYVAGRPEISDDTYDVDVTAECSERPHRSLDARGFLASGVPSDRLSQTMPNLAQQRLSLTSWK